MSTPGRNWRSSGGIGRSAFQNITSSKTSTSSNTVVKGNSVGQNNSKTVFKGHVDVSDNSLLNVGCVYFSDGTVQCTAGSSSSKSLFNLDPVIQNIQITTNFSNDVTSPYYVCGTLKNITTNQITTIYNTPFAPGNKNILLTIDGIRVSEGVSRVTATISGIVVNKNTGVTSTVIEEVILSSIDSSSKCQSLNKWFYVTNIFFEAESGSIDSIEYDIDVLDYIDFFRKNVKILGYRLESLGDQDNSGSDIGIELTKVSQSGSVTTLTTLENISVDGNGGTAGTGEIIDSLRTGFFNRNFTMPAGTNLWEADTNFVISSKNFDNYFTDDENHISGNNYGGLIVALTSSAFGGLTGPRYASIIIYYSELN